MIKPPFQPSPTGEGGRAERTCPVGKFSEGARLQGWNFSPLGEIRKGVNISREKYKFCYQNCEV
jgi:hypothetical protein